MSMLSMADARVARQRLRRAHQPSKVGGMPPREADEPDRARATHAPGTPGEGVASRPLEETDAGFQGNANQLVRYVPTEILGAYVAFIAILSPLSSETCEADFGSRWRTYGAFVVATPIVQYLIYRVRANQASEEVERPWAECIVATVAFAAWAAALPGAPFLDICEWSAEYGVLVAATVAVLIVLVANAFNLGLRPKDNEDAS